MAAFIASTELTFWKRQKGWQVHNTAILRGNRGFAHRLIDSAPEGSVVEIKPPRRTLDQNSLIHALITRIVAAKPEGRVYPIHVWKPLFMAMAGHKVRWEPALDGEGVVAVGMKTSKLTKAECSELIECIYSYAAKHGVKLED